MSWSYLKEFLDADGYICVDLVCPIQCGYCCYYWFDVAELKPLVQVHTAITDCPHNTGIGCELERRKRPIQCTAHLCELAVLKKLDMVTAQEIKETLDASAQEIAFSFLRKKPQTAQNKKLKFRPEDKEKILKYLNQR